MATALMNVLQRQVDRLTAEKSELIQTLSMSRNCIAYCRRNHEDLQHGDGIPIEALIDELIERVSK